MSGRQVVWRGNPTGKLQQALAYHQQGDLKRAERIYLRMLKKDGSDGQALHLLGLLKHDQGKSVEAVTLIRRAIQYHPTQSLLYLNLGVIFEARHCYTEAIACYTRAIKLAPDEVFAYFNMGVVYGALAEPEMAAAYFEKALAIDPELTAALDNRIYQLDLSTDATGGDRLGARRRWNDTFGAKAAREQQPHANDPDPDRVLRVGYVSSDFRQHSAWLVFSPVMLGHTDRVQAYAYSGDKREDDATRRLRDGGVIWRSTAGMDDATVAGMVRDDGIDILVDLSGYTAGNRMPLFARKPAPVQVTAWGYATGTGLDQMDAFFTDPIATPPKLADQFSEALVYLPSVVAYNHPSDMPDVAFLPAYDLDGMVTFGNFGQPKKLSTKTLQLWARVLQAVPNSRLVLRHGGLDQTYCETRVRDHFEDAGIETGRVFIFGGSAHYDHVAAFTDLDIQLDSQPASGGMTTLEAAWMGVPTLTMYGDRTAARISASIMTTLGLPDWIARDEDDYVRLAVEKARDLAALAALRARLRDCLKASVICDQARYGAAVEQAYRDLWRKWVATQRERVYGPVLELAGAR